MNLIAAIGERTKFTFRLRAESRFEPLAAVGQSDARTVGIAAVLGRRRVRPAAIGDDDLETVIAENPDAIKSMVEISSTALIG